MSWIQLQMAMATVITACWVAFGAIFVLRKKPAIAAAERKRDLASWLGILLQAGGFAVVWWLPRRSTDALFQQPVAVGVLMLLLVVVLGLGSIWLIQSAVKTLGKEWSYTARVVEGHRLVTWGPFGLVRHPIYTGMLGLLVAAGIAIGRWPTLVAGAGLFVMGTWMRVRSEERLLAGAFGEAYREYVQRVPAVLPMRLARRPGAGAVADGHDTPAKTHGAST